MKKVILLLCFVVSILNVYAQEVRGVETRRAIYQGEEYVIEYSTDKGYYPIVRSSDYYGFEFTNRNSIPVSVSIEIYAKGNPDKLVYTKDVVLQSQESYICKFPTIRKYSGEYYHNVDHSYVRYEDIRGEDKLKYVERKGTNNADFYYVKYKAYKLL